MRKPLCVLLLLAAAGRGQVFAPLQSLQEYNNRHIAEAIEQIPEADLDYRPTPDVRSVRELLGHIADTQYKLCAEARAESDPAPALEKKKLAKAELLKAVSDSIGYCDVPYKNPSASMARPLTVNVYHTGQHYGNLVTYMRLRGLLPPGASPPPARGASAPPQMVTYYLGLLVRGPEWTPEQTPAIERLQENHLAHLRKMHEAGRLVIAGPLTDGGRIRGILVYRGSSIEECKAWAEADPAVQASRLAVEMHPWMVQKGILP